MFTKKSIAIYLFYVFISSNCNLDDSLIFLSVNDLW